MGFNTPLTSPQYAKLRSSNYAGIVNVSFFSQRVVFAGQINQDLTGSNRPWWDFDYDNVTVGAYTDVEDGQTLIIGTTNDLTFSALHERLFHGRVRGTPSSSNMPANITSTAIPDNAYFWVLDEWELRERLSRPTGTLPNIIQKVDTVLDYESMMPRVYGLQTMYAGYPDAITGKLRLTLSVTGFCEQVGASISSYLYKFRSGVATVISGSLSSPSVVVDIDPDACAEWGETWGELDVTQSDGVVLVRKFGIKIQDDSHPPQISIDGIQVQASWSQNYTASLPAFAGVDNIFPGTPAVLWRADEFYGTTPGGLTDNNIEFVGWFVNEQSTVKGDKEASTVSDTTFQLAGVGARLAYLIEQLLTIINDSSPSLWDHIWLANPRRSVWHVLSRHSTAGMLCDLNFDADNLTEQYLFPYFPFKGSNILGIVNALMTQVNGALEFAPDGRIFACRDLQYLTADQIAATTPIANWTATDGYVVSLSADYNNNVGVIDANGAALVGGTQTVQAFKSRAPGLSQGESSGTGTLNDQVLASNTSVGAQAELNNRSGVMFAIQNLTEELTIDHRDGYNFLIPSRCEVYTWTIDQTVVGPRGVTRIVYDTSTLWFVKSVNYQPSNDGKRRVRVVYRKLALNTSPGQTPPATPDLGNTVPPLTPIALPSLPSLPPFPDAGLPSLPPAYKPPTGKITHFDGNTVIVNNDTDAWIAESYIALHSPKWRGITPSDLGSFQIKAVCFDRLGPPNNACGVYLLASDGTNSAIWYTSNALVSPPSWTKGATFSGVYSQIRSAGTAGSVLVYSSLATQTETVYDFTLSDWGFVPLTFGAQPIGAYSPGVGWIDTDWGVDPFGHFHRDIQISKSFSSSNVVKIISYYSVTFGPDPIGDPIGPYIEINGGDVARGPATNTSAGVLTFNGSVGSVTSVGARLLIDGETSGPALSGSGIITKLVVVTGSGHANVRLSSDYGATVGSAIDLGSSPGGLGGFDLAPVVGTSYAASSLELLKATSLGGSYSNFAALSANAVSACIPYYQVGSSTVKQTASSSPQVVIGYAAPVSGTCIAWIDGAGTITPITNPASGAFFDGANRITMLRGKKMAIIVNVGGTEKLYVTENLTAAGTATWTLVESVSSDATLRSRRNDSLNGTHLGQLFLFDSPDCGYSSHWASAGEFTRISPDSGLICGDVYN